MDLGSSCRSSLHMWEFGQDKNVGKILYKKERKRYLPSNKKVMVNAFISVKLDYFLQKSVGRFLLAGTKVAV